MRSFNQKRVCSYKEIIVIVFSIPVPFLLIQVNMLTRFSHSIGTCLFVCLYYTTIEVTLTINDRRSYSFRELQLGMNHILLMHWSNCYPSIYIIATASKLHLTFELLKAGSSLYVFPLYKWNTGFFFFSKVFMKIYKLESQCSFWHIFKKKILLQFIVSLFSNN